MIQMQELDEELSLLRSKRQTLERQQAYRLATMSEFESVKIQSMKRLIRKMETMRIANAHKAEACARQSKDTFIKISNVQNSAMGKQLSNEKDKYFRRIEALYPDWAERMEKAQIQNLRNLDREEKKVIERREIATEAFEKETSLRNLLTQKELSLRIMRDREREEQEYRNEKRREMEKIAEQLVKRQNDKPKLITRGSSKIQVESQDTALPRSPHMKSSTIVSTPRSEPSMTREDAAVGAETPHEMLDSDSNTSDATSEQIPEETSTTESAHSESVPEYMGEFVLTFEWQKVPRGADIPNLAERRDDGKNGTFARIPASWMMSILVDDTPVSVRVDPGMKIRQIIREALLESNKPTNPSPWMLQLNHSLCDGDATVAKYGVDMLVGVTRLVKAVQDVSLVWETRETILERLDKLLRQSRNYREIEYSLYGTKAIQSPDGTISQLRTEIRDHEPDVDSFKVPVICSVFIEEVQSCSSLFPHDLHEKLIDDAQLLMMIEEFHNSCSDSRGKVWLLLRDHWEWLFFDNLLSIPKIAEIFSEAFFPQLDAMTETVESVIRYVLEGFRNRKARANSLDSLLGFPIPKPTSVGEPVDNLSSISPVDSPPPSVAAQDDRFRRITTMTLSDTEDEDFEAGSSSAIGRINDDSLKPISFVSSILSEVPPRSSIVSDESELTEDEFDF